MFKGWLLKPSGFLFFLFLPQPLAQNHNWEGIVSYQTNISAKTIPAKFHELHRILNKETLCHEKSVEHRIFLGVL